VQVVNPPVVQVLPGPPRVNSLRVIGAGCIVTFVGLPVEVKASVRSCHVTVLEGNIGAIGSVLEPLAWHTGTPSKGLGTEGPLLRKFVVVQISQTSICVR
jgi:hypothetical protein